MNKTIYFIMLILLVSFAYAAPPTQVFQDVTGEGLEIEFTDLPAAKVGQAYNLKVHLFNGSTGYPVTTGASCYLHLYNESLNHIAESVATTALHTFDYELAVSENNFSKVGYYPYIVQCNTSKQGGFVAGTIEATNDGRTSLKNFAWVGWLLFVPIAMVIIFLLWGHLLPDEHNVLKWFFRLLALIFTFVIYNTAYVLISYESTLTNFESVLSIPILRGIIWAMFGYILIYLIYKIFMSFKHNKEWEWNNRFMK